MKIQLDSENMYSKILQTSKDLAGIVHNTPIITSKYLDDLTGFKLFIKCENLQKMGAFKFRGAYNAIRKLNQDEKQRGVITHSSGNHAQAIALAGKMHGIETIIIMPKNSPKVKIEATRGYGAEIVFCEATIKAREQKVAKLIEENNYSFIHPYDNNNVIEGAGTAAVEILDELKNLIALVAPIGGGGLISGSAIVAKESGKVKYVFGAEPKNADDAFLSIQNKKLLPQTNPNTIADGLRTQLSELTFSYIRKYVDEIITVSENEILDAMRIYFERLKIVVEPSGAVSLAAIIKLSKTSQRLFKGSKIGLIISGGNIEFSEFFRILESKLGSY